MDYELLHKSSTGVASEVLVAGELARRGYNPTITLGNTKAIDLMAEKNGNVLKIQVKGMQRTKSICWNISLEKMNDPSLVYILVNLHADELGEKYPEYFILTSDEVRKYFKPAKSGRDYLDYNLALQLGLKDRWNKLTF